MASHTPRVAAAAGWIAFLGIVGGLIVGPTLIAGQPPTIATPLPQAMAYFGHPELVGINALLAVFVAALPIIPFGLGMRDLFGDPDRDGPARRIADLAFLVLLATLPVYVVSGVLGASLVTVADSDPTVFAALHTVYQLLYNGAADVLEGAWILAFGLAGISQAGRRSVRWLGWLGVALGLSRWIKSLVVVGLVPDAIIPISGLLFVAWFLAVVIAVTKRAWQPTLVDTVSTAGAGA